MFNLWKNPVTQWVIMLQVTSRQYTKVPHVTYDWAMYFHVKLARMKCICTGLGPAFHLTFLLLLFFCFSWMCMHMLCTHLYRHLCRYTWGCTCLPICAQKCRGWVADLSYHPQLSLYIIYWGEISQSNRELLDWVRFPNLNFLRLELQAGWHSHPTFMWLLFSWATPTACK